MSDDLTQRAERQELQEKVGASDRKQRALIAQWRQAANEATTADAAVTYTECADALEAAIAAKILVAVCEGCGATRPMPTRHLSKVYPDLPVGWSECGVSTHRLAGHGVRLAAWCPACRVSRPSTAAMKNKRRFLDE